MAEVSVLYREPKLLKLDGRVYLECLALHVSVLYREPKLLKCLGDGRNRLPVIRFSALP